MAFKLKNTPEKMFHKAEGQVQQPQLPGLKEEGSYAGNPDGAGKYGKNPDAAGKILPIVPTALGVAGAYLGKKIYDKGKQMYDDYQSGKKARTSSQKSGGASSENASTKKSSGTYESAKKNNPNLDNLIKTRNSSKKGTQAYVDAQNAINKAYGSSKVHKVSQPSSQGTESTTPKTTTPKVDAKPAEVKKAPATTEAKAPKKETSIKAGKLRAKGEAALESGNVKKAQRMRKRYDRKTARDNKKAARQENRANKKAARQEKRQAIKSKREEIRAIRKGGSSPAQKKYCKK